MADRCELFSSQRLPVGFHPMFQWSKGSPDAVRAAFTPLCVLTVDADRSREQRLGPYGLRRVLLRALIPEPIPHEGFEQRDGQGPVVGKLDEPGAVLLARGRYP